VIPEQDDAMSALATDPSAADDLRPGRHQPATLEPDRNLLRYYLLTSLLFGPGFLFAVVPMYFRFRTLRYDVDDEGITMRWGILFRREISLTYARIQDIQLASNVVERWLGLARIQLQTASGSASAEMTIEGLRDVEAMRDFLYSRMRGVGEGGRAADARQLPPRQGHAPVGAGIASVRARDAAVAAGPLPPTVSGDETAAVVDLTAALDAVAAELRALRLSTGGTSAPGGDDA
jgi:membrane protein YdbS with pleckstrin-like domain